MSSTNSAWSRDAVWTVLLLSTWLLTAFPVSVTASRQHLRSAASHQLVVPSYRLSSYRRRAFSVAGPTTWNSLPKQLRDPVHTTSVFAHILKTFLFSKYLHIQRIGGCFLALMRYINWCFTSLLACVSQWWIRILTGLFDSFFAYVYTYFCYFIYLLQSPCKNGHIVHLFGFS